MIITLLALVLLMGYQAQVAKAHDVTRKDHFRSYKIMFEDYYSDHACYPTQAEWDACTCGGSCFSPYLREFFCDPVSKQKYYYYPFTDADGNSEPCRGYRLYTKLNTKIDPDIPLVGCSWMRGCGNDVPLSTYNWGMSMGGPLTAADFNPEPTGTPGPTATPTPTSIYGPGCQTATGPHACNTGGTCNGYNEADFSNGRCSVGFKDAQCCIDSGCPASIRCAW